MSESEKLGQLDGWMHRCIERGRDREIGREGGSGGEGEEERERERESQRERESEREDFRAQAYAEDRPQFERVF